MLGALAVRLAGKLVGGAGLAGDPAGVMVAQGREKGRYRPQNTRKGSSAGKCRGGRPRARNGLKMAANDAACLGLIIGLVCPASDGCVPEKERRSFVRYKKTQQLGQGAGAYEREPECRGRKMARRRAADNTG